ncbi:uncharacterized protein LOC117518641 [Thalassophryne amazonica]|uniref:uncharacterized protein LOC117518641 n=1 Tax=Thalassophryne amazonica TaxID=390379 RepID=UPI001471F9D1|nr:uncharacterized protein LOC117518641 [Thalassophryne amazonica]
MKRFKKYITDKQKEQQERKPQFDSEWSGDEAQLLAESQRLEEIVTSQVSHSIEELHQPETAPKKCDHSPAKTHQPKTSPKKRDHSPAKTHQPKTAPKKRDHSPAKTHQPKTAPKKRDHSPAKTHQPKTAPKKRDHSPAKTHQPKTVPKKHDHSPAKTHQPEPAPKKRDHSPAKTHQPETAPKKRDHSPAKTHQPKTAPKKHDHSPAKTHQPETAAQSKHHKHHRAAVRPQQQSSANQPTQSLSTSQGQDHHMESALTDSSVELEGWVRSWENPNGIPSADLSWIKEDTERGLFGPIQTYKGNTGVLKRRRVMKSDRMWFYPPEPQGYATGGVPTPHLFFRSRIFVWRPVGVWRCSLKCPRGDKCVGAGQSVHLYKSGYHHRVRHICDVSGWYTMITKVLCCGPCTKAARSGEGGTVAQWHAWDAEILSQLSEAHQAMFPAILTSKRGVDRNVVRLLRGRTEGNTMVKVRRQIQENHMEEYLHHKDLYTTLLKSLMKPGGIVSALGHACQPPPPLRELPSAWLLRHAFLLAEASHVQDYRSQILSTFGTVLKMDSTKKVVKKLSGEGEGSAEWFTSIGNEFSQIVTFVLTCEESTDKLEPMCRGLVQRFQTANQPTPKILYVAHGCCRAQCPTAVETLFQPWVDNGMVVRLDIFHWIHRFDTAIRTESHSRYAAFKSALAGAVLAYNRKDLDRLIEAIRAKDQAALQSLSDEDVVRRSISNQSINFFI